MACRNARRCHILHTVEQQLNGHERYLWGVFGQVFCHGGNRRTRTGRHVG